MICKFNVWSCYLVKLIFYKFEDWLFFGGYWSLKFILRVHTSSTLISKKMCFLFNISLKACCWGNSCLSLHCWLMEVFNERMFSLAIYKRQLLKKWTSKLILVYVKDQQDLPIREGTSESLFSWYQQPTLTT